MDIFNLSGKNAVVTGGYGHLGKGMVEALIGCNANVIVAGKSIDKFNATFPEKSNKYLHFREIDILETESIENCFSSIVGDFGSLDIVVNNAHATKGNSQENMSDNEWNYTMEAIAGSVHKAIRAAIPIMKNRGSGKIINIASMYGMVSPDFSLYQGDGCEVYTNPPHYGAAKAAVIQLTKYYAVLLGKYNIQVNAIAPGPFPKPAIQQENPAFIERLKKGNPMHKIGRPEDLAGVVALLSSRGSDFITGQTIQVDGGWTLW